MKYLAIAIIYAFVSITMAQKRVVCYFPSWTSINPNPSICTHLIYSFLNIGADGSIVPFDASGFSLTAFTGLRSQNSALKVILGIGGATASNFGPVAANNALINIFANNVAQIINTYGFDGVDIDWEYPSVNENFIGLLTAVRNALPNGKILSIAVAPDSTRASASYNAQSVSAIVDFINLMTYDFHGGWETQTYSQAPLYGGTLDTSPYWKSLNVDACVGYWISQGVPKDKLVVGVPLYGRSYTLVNSNNNGVAAPATGQAGNPSTPVYNQICSNIKNNGWKSGYYNPQAISYAYSGNQWVSYDDLVSLTTKISYIKSNNLGGIMFWSMDQDDYLGNCGNGKYPMISTAYNLLIQNSVIAPNVTVVTTTTTTTLPPTTQAATPPSGSFSCPLSSGIFTNPSSCTSYISCANGVAFIQECPKGLNFNGLTRVCDYPSNAPCSNIPPIIQVTTTKPIVNTNAPTLAPTTTTTTKPIIVTNPATVAPTSAPSSSNPCANKLGIIANPADCNTFYNCGPGGAGTLMNCGPGLGFNAAIQACDYKSNIPGCI
ncbi:hypothetical protein PVAND_006432 [Polypedilum vanderplanki]|uniref:Chitinase n=1 Tax=Polypedilum vanderplanki TaxID=319348 RepID=A0A9J6C459_POLVA|nr:hypothetical protein PVAND_006432 [Polypedilum vanderplanki]